MDRLHVALTLAVIVLAAALAYVLSSSNSLMSENASLRAKLEEKARAAEEYGRQLEQLKAEREALEKRVNELEGEVSALQGALEEKGRLADLLLKPVVIVVNNSTSLSADVEARPGYVKVSGIVYVVRVKGLDRLPPGSEAVVVLRQANPVLGGLLAFTLTSGGGRLLVDNLYPSPALWSVRRDGATLVINTTIPFEDLTLSQMYVYIGVASTVNGVKVLLPPEARLLGLNVSEAGGCAELAATLSYTGGAGHYMALTVAKGSGGVASLQLEPGRVYHIRQKLGCQGPARPLLLALLPWPS